MLAGARVLFAFVSHGQVGDGRCEYEIASAVQVEALWKRMLRTAGASEVVFSNGLPSLEPPKVGADLAQGK
jgi:hypothetical protein